MIYTTGTMGSTTNSYIYNGVDSAISDIGWTTADRIVYNSPQSKWSNLISKLRNKPKETIKLWRQNMFNPQKFFESIKGSLLSIKELKADSMSVVEELIKEAKDSGQVAYHEHLIKEKKRITKELLLIQTGFLLYVSNSDIERFNKVSHKSIKLDSIKNYCRQIPKKILEELTRAKSINVFNEFKILHYDPTGEATKLTEKEKEAKKDPILFGTIEGSERLYYIGDWIDEYCNLTLDEFLNVIDSNMKERTLTLSNITSDVMAKIAIKKQEKSSKLLPMRASRSKKK